MKPMFYLIIFMVLLFQGSPSFASREDSKWEKWSQIEKSPEDKDKDYEFGLDAILSNPIVDPGEKIKIELFIIGWPLNIDDNKLVIYASPTLTNDNWTFTSFDYNTKTMSVEEPPRKNHLGNTVIAKLQSTYFNIYEEETKGILSGSRIPWQKEKVAPITIETTISKEVMPGDHPILINLVYKLGNKVRIANSNIVVKVRSYGERYLELLTTLGGLLIPLISFLSRGVHKRRKTEFCIISSISYFFLLVLIQTKQSPPIIFWIFLFIYGAVLIFRYKEDLSPQFKKVSQYISKDKGKRI